MNVEVDSINNFPSSHETTYYSDLEAQTCTNLPTFLKQPIKFHPIVLILNLTLYFLIAVAIITQIYSLGIVIALFYIAYLIVGLKANNKYFANMREYNYMEEKYQTLKEKTGNIQFKAQHFKIINEFGFKSEEITNSISRLLPVKNCTHVSEDLSLMKKGFFFNFCKVKWYYCFADANSQNIFMGTFFNFKNNYQSNGLHRYIHTLSISDLGFSGEIGLSFLGTGDYVKFAYVALLLVGLGYISLMVLECLSERYTINYIKRVTLEQPSS